MAATVYVLLTMDCETSRSEVTAHAAATSPSGPADYEESERSVRGYAETARKAGYPVTLFAHPEVAAAQRNQLLDLEGRGACLGLHLHPYKLGDGRYRHDLGAYPADAQRAILEAAVSAWEAAMGRKPGDFRAGYFSANDSTFGILESLGFRGGSLSNPGRVLPGHCSVWRGAEIYPHRAHTGFRLIEGTSDFIEVPVAGALNRPVERGHAGEQGYEWPYIPHTYDHAAGVRDILTRFADDDPAFPTLVTDTHNDHDYTDPSCPARGNLDRILDTIRTVSDELGLQPEGVTLDTLCDRVRGG